MSLKKNSCPHNIDIFSPVKTFLAHFIFGANMGIFGENRGFF